MAKRMTTRGRRTRRGLTLLELMLALSLAGLVIFAIGMAIDLHLRTLDARRTVIEESQVARSVMRLISSDLRQTAIVYEQDLAALESLSEQFKQSGAAALIEAAGAMGEGEPSGGGDSEGGGGTGGGGAGGGGAGGGGAEGAGAGGGETGGGGAGGGGTGGGEETGGAGGETGGESTGGTEDPTTELEETSNTEDIANTTTLPSKPGLYGNQYELMIDVARPPRFDEFIPEQATEIGEVTDIPSDVKSIVYYLQPPSATATGMGAQDAFGDPNVTGGLVRRRLDRAITKWAMDNGNMQGLSRKSEIIAPEVVALEFRYFDGQQWLTEWDSDSMGGLPMAVEIVMIVRAPSLMNEPLTTTPANPADLAAAEGSMYRSVVRLPTAKPATGAEEELESEAAGLENLGL